MDKFHLLSMIRTWHTCTGARPGRSNVVHVLQIRNRSEAKARTIERSKWNKGIKRLEYGTQPVIAPTLLDWEPPLPRSVVVN
nr:hypothetical protein Iba_chr12aCG21330 [Ipomoea batatas]